MQTLQVERRTLINGTLIFMTLNCSEEIHCLCFGDCLQSPPGREIPPSIAEPHGSSPVPRAAFLRGHTHLKTEPGKLHDLAFGLRFNQNSGFRGFSAARRNPAAQRGAQR